jgi:hypothetical protein
VWAKIVSSEPGWPATAAVTLSTATRWPPTKSCGAAPKLEPLTAIAVFPLIPPLGGTTAAMSGSGALPAAAVEKANV